MADRAIGRITPYAITTGKLLLLFSALNTFFVSIKLLGAFKDLGLGYGETLIVELAANPGIGLLLGLLVTSVIQSSSTTTSLVVGLAAGGVFGSDPAIAVKMAVPIIMGANIGTTITSVLVSMGHIGNKREFKRAFNAATVHDFFNILAVIVWFPIQLYTNIIGRASLFMANVFEDIGGLKLVSPLKLLVDPQAHVVKHFFATYQDAVHFVIVLALMLMAFGLVRFLSGRFRDDKPTLMLGVAGVAAFSFLLTMVVQHPSYVFLPETAVFLLALGALFVALFAIVKLMRSMMQARIERLFHDVIFKSDLRGMLLGIFITAVVQSSSVTISLAVPLAGAGIITARHVYPFALGANVGTTITALLAALATGNHIGLAIAFAHLLFNLMGIAVWYPLKRVPLWISENFAELSVRSRVVPILFIIGVYLLLPLVLITVLR